MMNNRKVIHYGMDRSTAKNIVAGFTSLPSTDKGVEYVQQEKMESKDNDERVRLICLWARARLLDWPESVKTEPQKKAHIKKELKEKKIYHE